MKQSFDSLLQLYSRQLETVKITIVPGILAAPFYQESSGMQPCHHNYKGKKGTHMKVILQTLLWYS